MIEIVAEIGANHLGDYRRSIQLIEAAADAGATHVKFQCWTADSMCVSDYVMPSGPWKGQRLRELYQLCYTPWEWFPALFDYARSCEIIPFASAFDIPAVRFLETLRVDRHKVASFEINDLTLIREMARTGKRVILSCGAASLEDIDEAIDIIDAEGEAPITLLKCTSAYPARPADANLLTMMDMSYRFPDVEVGLSDHTFGTGVAVAAVALGAKMVEKHLTLSRADGGPDAGFSMEPDEFADMAAACVQAAEAIGTSDRYGGEALGLRRSLWVSRAVRQGDLLTPRNVASARPAGGLEPKYLTNLLGMRFNRDVPAGTPLDWSMVSGEGN